MSQGASFIVQVFAHRPEQTDEARRQAKQVDEEAEIRGFKSLEMEIRRGSELVFELSIQGFLEIDEPIQRLVWHGRRDSVLFGVTVPVTNLREL